MENIIKLHIAVMRFVHNRADSLSQPREEGFTTAELLGNAALAIGALVLIWGFFKTSLIPNIETYIKNNVFN